jgi:hypothetical protein
MIIAMVMKEIADQVDTIPGLNVFDFWVKKMPVPGATVGLPTRVGYDKTYGRGSDSIDVPLLVMVGAVDAASSARALMTYMDGSGPRSVKAVLEAHEWTTCDEVVVAEAAPDVYSSGGVLLLGAEFTLEVLGQGISS